MSAALTSTDEPADLRASDPPRFLHRTPEVPLGQATQIPCPYLASTILEMFQSSSERSRPSVTLKLSHRTPSASGTFEKLLRHFESLGEVPNDAPTGKGLKLQRNDHAPCSLFCRLSENAEQHGLGGRACLKKKIWPPRGNPSSLGPKGRALHSSVNMPRTARSVQEHLKASR